MGTWVLFGLAYAVFALVILGLLAPFMGPKQRRDIKELFTGTLR